MANLPPSPPASNYYRPPSGPSPFTPGGPGVSIDAITVAWQIISSDWSTWVPAVLITWLVSFGVSMAGNFFSHLMLIATLGQITAITVPVIAVFVTLTLVISSLTQGVSMVLHVGLMNLAYKRLAGEPYNLNDIFVGFSRFWAIFGAAALAQILVTVGLILLIVPGMYLMGALALAPLIALRQGVGPVDAVKRSMATISGGNAFMMFLVAILALILTAAGAIACLVGLLFTGAIYFCTIGTVYFSQFPPTPPAASAPVGPEAPKFQS